ncbi:MAG: 3-hydroxyacyl-CoA dehydrogenase/enoyl-CoA hydratase family protein, partial [Deltaproteobacteria bacterium]
MEIKKVAVLGAGTMGAGIAQVCAQAGYEVWVRDIKDEFIEKGKATIEKNLRKAVNKGKISLLKLKEIQSKLHYTTDLKEAVSDADLVIEAVPEVMDIKKEVFKEVCEYNKKAILATNTSGLSITELAKATDRPDKFVGMHFFNPVPVMALVEIIKGEQTSDETVNIAVEFVKSIGKTPVVVKKDIAGFIVNRCLVPYLLLAIQDYENGVASKEEIDATMIYNYSFPMGPIELSDFVGLDILYFATQQWDIAPKSKALEEKFKAKELGMKTGIGFYDWRTGRPKIPRELAGKYDGLRLIAPMVNIAADLIQQDVASAEEIDTAMKLGTNMPKGPCEMADEIGLDKILAKVEEIYKEKGYEILKPSEYLKKLVEEGKTGKDAGEG